MKIVLWKIIRSEKHNFLNEEINNIVLSLNDDKRMGSINLIKTYTYEMNNIYEMNKDLVYKKEEVKCNNIIKQCKNV